MDDGTLLARFATSDRSANSATAAQDAFRLLVQRHIDLVYAAARRQVTDPGLAQDVTQAVFLLLSQKARQLQGHASLSGWLIQATHYICRDARKQAQRRRIHEARAAMSHPSATETSDDAWESIRPLLDEAMLRLGNLSRTAVALRFLENRPLKEVGAALGISEEAARKRVDRALGQLRKTLAARGVVASAALGTLLPAKAVDAAPAATLAAATASATPAATALAAGGARLFLWMHMKLALAAGLIILITAAASIPLLLGSPAPAPAAAPAATGPSLGAPASGGIANTQTRPTVLYRGVLLDAAGSPAPNATLRTFISDWNINDDHLEAESKTAADGTFIIGPLPDISDSEWNKRVLVFDVPNAALTWKWEEEFRFENPAALRFQLAQPAPVAGTISDARGQPVPGALVEAALGAATGASFRFNRATGLAATTDAQGHYHFDRIPRDQRLQLTVRHPDYQTWSTQFRRGDPQTSFPVAAGTADADIQLADRPATIRVQLTQAGAPLARPDLLLFAVDPSLPSRIELARTDAAGSAVFPGLAPGNWEVGTSRAPDNFQSLIMPVQGIVLQAGETRAISAELGTIPVHIDTLEADSPSPGTYWVGIQKRDTKRLVAGTSQNFPGPCDLRLPPGSYHLSCESWDNDTFKVLGQDFDVTAHSPGVKLTARAISPPRLRGQLVDTAGTPLAGLVVVDSRAVLVGPDGRFSMDAPPNASSPSIGVAVDSSRTLARGFIVTSSMLSGAEVQFVLEPMGSITGQAVDKSGRPLPDTRVEISFITPDNMGGISFDNSVWHTTIQSDGTFHIVPVPTGYRLQVYLRNRDQWHDDQLSPLVGGETRDLGVCILHGMIGTTRQTETYQRNTRPDPTLPPLPREVWDATLTGRLLDEAGQPVLGVRLHVVPNFDASPDLGGVQFDQEATTDLKGRFTVTELPPNRSLILSGYVVDHDGNLAPYAWTVTPSPIPLELRLTPAARAAGTQPN